MTAPIDPTDQLYQLNRLKTLQAIQRHNLTIKQIAAAAKMNTVAASTHVRWLAARGYIERRCGRVTGLTVKGRQSINRGELL